MKCGRTLKRPSESGYGPVCARAVLGVKPRPVKRERRAVDESTPDLFPLELRFHELVEGVSLEMDA